MAGRPRPEAGHPGARRERPRHHPRRRRPGRGGRRDLRRGLRQQRPDLLGHQAGLRPRSGCTTRWSTRWPARAKAVTVGDGTDAANKLGPINNAPQYERVSELVADALAHGAHAAAGGKPMDRPGLLLRAHGAVGPLRRGADRGRGAVRAGAAGHLLPRRRRRRGAGQRDALRAERARCGGPTPTGPPRWPAGWRRARPGSTCTWPWARNSPSAGSSGAGSGWRTAPGGSHEFTDIQTMHRSRSTTGLSPDRRRWSIP